jgi:hypothetical protein
MNMQMTDPEAIAADAEQRLAALREQEGRLALDALTDEGASAELAEIETAIANCEADLRRAALAKTERQRRLEAAQTAAEQEARAKALAGADKLAVRLGPAARKVDQAAAALGEAVKDHRTIVERELALRIEAGTVERPSGWHSGPPYELAIRHALGAAGVGDVLDPRLGVNPPPRPLHSD